MQGRTRTARQDGLVKTLRILAIESSCDETSVALVEVELEAEHGARRPPFRVRVLAHRVESQIASHQPFGGVVPEVAARDHLAKIHSLTTGTLQEASVALSSCTHMAVTAGPGLIGALMVGVLYARGAALAAGLPLVAVNHVDAHLAPCFLLESFSPRLEAEGGDLGRWHNDAWSLFPALTLTVSGGHCILGLADSPTQRTVLGQTADDACGEAFDKVAKLLGLPYPGGPEIERLAHAFETASTQQPHEQRATYVFPARLADTKNRHGFSFSGLKTAVLDAVRKETGYPPGKASGANLPPETKGALALAFQTAAVGQLADRLENALVDFPQVKSVLVAGGVAANSAFRARVASLPRPSRFAPLSLCSDNATMIGLQAALDVAAGRARDGFAVQAFPRYAHWSNTP